MLGEWTLWMITHFLRMISRNPGGRPREACDPGNWGPNMRASWGHLGGPQEAHLQKRVLCGARHELHTWKLVPALLSRWWAYSSLRGSLEGFLVILSTAREMAGKLTVATTEKPVMARGILTWSLWTRYWRMTGPPRGTTNGAGQTGGWGARVWHGEKDRE